MRVFIFKLLRFKDISNTKNNTLIGGTSGNDSIHNIKGNKVTIEGGNGNDTIYNEGAYDYGDNVLVLGGAGNDSIVNHYGADLTLSGGKGNDTIKNNDRSNSINGGAGNDVILNTAFNNLFNGHSLTVEGGTGNDSILNNGGNYILFKYASGDGKDTIQGFNSTSTLSISGSSYSTTKSGSNVIVTVDTGKITLSGAASLDAVNIKFKKTASKVSIPSDAYTYNGHSYYLFDNSLTWSAAKAYCESLGGHLAVITSAGEQAAIQTLLSKKGSKDSYWLGGYRNSSGSFNWVTGENFSYTNWGPDEPNNTAEDAIMIFKAVDTSSSSKFGEWNDLSSNGTSGYSRYYGLNNLGLICEWDTVSSNSKLITLTSKADTYSNSVEGATIQALGGNDYINNWGDSASINGGNGNDSIHNIKSNVDIRGGDGDDYIENGGATDDMSKAPQKVTISGGEGNDYITNFEGSAMTIIGGTGNDTIKNWSENVLFKYADGDGNDKIYGFKSDSTLSITGGTYSSAKSSNNVIVTIGTGKITLVGAVSLSAVNIKGTLDSGGKTLKSSASNTSLVGGTENDSLYIGHYSVTTSGGAGNDTIWGYESDYAKIYGGDGNDIIYNYQGDYSYMSGGNGNDSIYNKTWISTVDAGNGNDTIVNLHSGKNTSINGGAGNDLISIVSSADYTHDHTIKGGKGNDTIYGNSSVTNRNDGTTYQFSSGDGNDIIYNFTKYDKISLGGGEYTRETVGNDVIVSLVGGGSMTLKKAKGKTINIVNGTNVDDNSWTLKGTTATYGTASKTLVTIKEVKSVDGLSLKNKVVTVSNSALNQKKVTISSGYTLALGSDVTKSTSKVAGWTKSGTTATYKAASTSAGYKLANNQINYIKKSGGATLATVKGVKNTDGLSVKNKIVTLKKSSLDSKVTLGGSYSFNLAAGNYNKTSVMGSANADVITSRGNNLSINGGKGNDTINVFGTGTTVTGGNGKDVFIYNGGNGRITDFKAEDTLRIGTGTGTYSSEASGKNLIVTVGNNKLTLVGAAGLSSSNISGTKKSESEGVIQNGKKVTLTEDYSSENFTFADDSSMLTVDASAVALDINIIGNRFINSILGGAGNDTLIGGKGNDKLDGGDGADIFVYTAGDGNDSIQNYTEEDRISIASGTVNGSIFSTSGNDVIVKVGSGKITVKDAKNTIVTCADKAGNEIGYRNGVVIKGDTVTLTGKYANTKFNVNDYTDYNGDIREINASAVQHKLNISGSENSDLIIGGNGDNTLNGGGGDDTLQGGNGKNIFVYRKGDGDDVILNYKETDAISIASGAIGGNVDYDGKDVIFHINGGSITVEGGNGSKITFIDKDGKSNGKIYKSTGMWFVEDDTNFDNADNQLGAIIKNSTAAYSFDTSKDLMSLTSKDTFIAYSDK